MSEGFTGDGDYLSFQEAEEDGTLDIGFKLSSIETASKIHELDKEYFSSYNKFVLTQDILEEYGIPDPSHTINYSEDGSIFLSLDWGLNDIQANQLVQHYAKQFLSVDDFKLDEQNVRIEGVVQDSVSLIFVANHYGNKWDLSIERICKDAQ